MADGRRLNCEEPHEFRGSVCSDRLYHELPLVQTTVMQNPSPGIRWPVAFWPSKWRRTCGRRCGCRGPAEDCRPCGKNPMCYHQTQSTEDDQGALGHITTWLSCLPALCNAKRTPRNEAELRIWTEVCPAGQLQPHVLHTIHASARRFLKPRISVLEFRLEVLFPSVLVFWQLSRY